jgi:hypothetical protein
MKPICDYSNCRTYSAVLYLGNNNYVAHGGHRRTMSYWPSGWDLAAADKFSSIGCCYSVNGANSLCSIGVGGSSHGWAPWSATRPFMCGAVKTAWAGSAGHFFPPKLRYWSWTSTAAKNNVPAQTYFMLSTSAATNNGQSVFSNTMVTECAKYKMKPICEHPSYCKQYSGPDGPALYLGQASHTAYGQFRKTMSNWPAGWSLAAANMFTQTGCTYQNPTSSSMCSHKPNGYGYVWDQWSAHRGFVCGTTVPDRSYFAPMPPPPPPPPNPSLAMYVTGPWAGVIAKFDPNNGVILTNPDHHSDPQPAPHAKPNPVP